MTYGPPFYGMTDDPYASDGHCLYTHNLLPLGNRLTTRPGFYHIETDTPADMGIYVTGYRDSFTAVFIGVEKSLTHPTRVYDHVYLTIARYDTYTVTDLTEKYGVYHKGLASCTSLGNTIVVALHTTCIFIDIETLAVSTTMEKGWEENTHSYLMRPPPASIVVSHNGLVWYAGLDSADIPVDITLDNDEPYADDTTWIVGSSIVRFPGRFILASESGTPHVVRSLDYFSIYDDNTAVTGLCPFQGALLIFTQKSVWLLSGQDNYRMDFIAPVGCVSHNSIRADVDAVYFLATDGIYYIDASMAVHRVEGVDFLFTNKITVDKNKNISIFPAALKNATACLDKKNRVYLLGGCFTHSGNRGVLLAVETANKTPAFWVFPPAVDFDFSVIANGNNSDIGSTTTDILAASRNVTRVYAADNLQQVDATPTQRYPIDCVWRSTYRVFPSITKINRVKMLGQCDRVVVRITSYESDIPYDAYPQMTTGYDTDTYAEQKVLPRWVHEDATSGPRWVAEDATDGVYWDADRSRVYVIPVSAEVHEAAMEVSSIYPMDVYAISADVQQEVLV